MTKTLTEQWCEGKLPDGAYYIIVDKYEQNKPEIDVGICYNSNFEWWIVKEVLAPVPSYDENNELVQKMHILEKRLEVSEKEHYRTLEQLRIATNALKETKEKLLHVELSGLDGDNRQKMYDLMFEDGVIDKAIKEMEGVK